MSPKRSPTRPFGIRLPSDLLALCQEHGVPPVLPIPSSQLEAEPVHRGVSLRTVVRAFLLRTLAEVGVL